MFFWMNKLYSGRIWITLLLTVIYTQNVFAETFEGRWLSSQGRASLATAILANSLQDIIDGQYLDEYTAISIIGISFYGRYVVSQYYLTEELILLNN